MDFKKPLDDESLLEIKSMRARWLYFPCMMFEGKRLYFPCMMFEGKMDSFPLYDDV